MKDFGSRVAISNCPDLYFYPFNYFNQITDLTDPFFTLCLSVPCTRSETLNTDRVKQNGTLSLSFGKKQISISTLQYKKRLNTKYTVFTSVQVNRKLLFFFLNGCNICY